MDRRAGSNDAIGNLTGDVDATVSNITWNVYGKLESFGKSYAGTGSVNSVTYKYDSKGDRVGKSVTKFYAAGQYDWYVRDAQGNVMAIYEENTTDVTNGTMYLKEIPIYGSSRLGEVLKNMDIDQPKVTAVNANLIGATYLTTFERGKKLFELSNHLGNVLVTVTDKKLGHDDGTGHADYYTADVATANDYYPFGMLQPGRNYNAPSAADYRYGFNGKENDNEAKGEGNEQDYGMRIYDLRLGRFLSVDPLSKGYPFYSPYQFAGNTPLRFTDLDGGEPKDYISKWIPSSLFYHNTNSYASAAFGANKSQMTIDIPGIGWQTVQGVYDNVTKQFWIIHYNQGTKKYEYYKATNGNNSEITLKQPKTGISSVSGGSFVEFETRNEKEARELQESFDRLEMVEVGIIAGFPAALEYGPGVLYRIYKEAKGQLQDNTKPSDEETVHQETDPAAEQHRTENENVRGNDQQDETVSLPKPRKGRGLVPREERDPKRFFTRKETKDMLERQEGKCPECGEHKTLDEVEGHHIERHADGAPTDPATNGAAVCEGCHIKLHQ